MKKQQRGFTLIELLVVIAIIGVLLGIVVPMLGSMQEKANITSCTNNLKQIAMSLADYRLRKGKKRRYPHGKTGVIVEAQPVIPFATNSGEGQCFAEMLFQGKKPVMDSTELFSCPSNDTDIPNEYSRAVSPYSFDIGRTAYLFGTSRPVFGSRKGSSGEVPIISDRINNHESGMVFLFFDMRAEFVDRDLITFELGEGNPEKVSMMIGGQATVVLRE
jgi:prepilin-type N-terminal cleavage/methylation domain-containing protein